MSINETLKDLPSFRERMEKIDRKRLMRLKEDRETRNLKRVLLSWASRETAEKTKILSDKQRQAIYLMTDFVHDFSYEYIATRLGIEVSILSKWRNDPLFLKELDREITRRRSFIRIHAFRNVHRAIMRGDMKATWNYLRMSGDLKETHEIVDRTGESELEEDQLNAEISRLTQALETAHIPHEN